MGELKIRLWLNTEGRMMYWDEIKKQPNLLEYLEHPNAMLFLGIKDRNGREIYEHDWFYNPQLNLRSTIENIRNVGIRINELKGCIVIGNLWENPEYLNPPKGKGE